MTSRRSLILAIAAVSLLFVASPAAADPGDLDSGFAGDGTAFIPDGGAALALPVDVGVQSDGRIVVVSNRSTGPESTEILVTRFTSRGRVDRSFGTNGRVAVQIDGASTSASRLAVQQDDGIVIAGNSGDGEQFAMTVIRLTESGTIDTGFGTGGHRVVRRGNNSSLNDVFVDGTGRIVAIGWSGDGVSNSPVLVRLTANGARDNSFDRDGVQTLPYPGSPVAYGHEIEPTASGRLVIAVEVVRAGGVIDSAIARVRSNGRLDTSFASNGYRRVTTSGQDRSRPVGLDVGADGRIVLLVHASNEPGVPGAHLVALTAAGALDTTFSGDGRLPMRSYQGGWVVDGFGDLEIEASGRVLVGLSEESDRSRDATVVALRPTGRIDRSFSGDGGVTFDYTWETESAISALAVTNSRIHVVGRSVDPLFEPIGGGIARVRLS
jgi:uncharacterized delta-60 repeat protein